MRKLMLALVCLALPAAVLAQGGDPPVKKSRAGICHEQGSPSYQRTRNFEPFDTLQACVASGGRAAANAPAPDKADEAGSKGKSWLDALGGKLLAIGGVLVLVLVAYWLSSRRRASSQSARIQDLEQKKWEGHRRE